LKNFILLIILITTTSCASLTGASGTPSEPINYNDGTWSKCKYTKGKTEYWMPMQNAPPVGTVQPDGTVISCEPIVN